MATGPKSKKKKKKKTSATSLPIDQLGGDAGDVLADPSAGLVLHRVLAGAARTFLLNDMDEELVDASSPTCDTFDPLSLGRADRPLWAESALTSARRAPRRTSEEERIHQSRVALRTIRSNLRTFRLVVDPSWGTSLRAELAWYGGRLGRVRDLHILRDIVTVKGPEVIAAEAVDLLDSVIGVRMAAALADVAAERGGARRFQLNEQLMVLWDGPDFRAKASRPADEVLPVMLQRAWHDLRGAAKAARKNASDAHLHTLRIRLKDLRYGCETVAFIAGGPARKTARAAEALQGKLGDLHDAHSSLHWFEEVARQHRELRDPVRAMVAMQRDAARTARKGWNRELRGVERRWRAWQG
jgi:CHAD domain-containing protein